MTLPILWYFADPMCSWCWGFAPTLDILRGETRERMRIALVLGGLRPGETAPMTAAARAEILHHWHEVHARTGQPFRFENALPDGFIYDTEPASRAVLAAATLDPAHTFPMFKAIQSAFYAEGHDVTQGDCLAQLAERLGLDAARFAAIWASDAARDRTRAHFRQARTAGVRGFPTLIVQQDERLTPVATGCEPIDTVRTRLAACHVA
ncbi:MAG: DsbA family protein [Pseudomonadota bacterium]